MFWVVPGSNVMAPFVQALATKLWIASRKNLAEHCADQFSSSHNDDMKALRLAASHSMFPREYGPAAASLILSAAPITALYLVMHKYMIKGIAVGAVNTIKLSLLLATKISTTKMRDRRTSLALSTFWCITCL
jgi:Mn2+/Fe2+ NRAMP family transporter